MSDREELTGPKFGLWANREELEAMTRSGQAKMPLTSDFLYAGFGGHLGQDVLGYASSQERCLADRPSRR